MTTQRSVHGVATAARIACALLIFAVARGASAELIVVGNEARLALPGPPAGAASRPRMDVISILDVRKAEAPRLVASVPVPTAVSGPPTNVAVTPDERLALVASPLRWDEAGPASPMVPDDRVFVIDLTARPPRPIGVVTVGWQPSGLSINQQGDLALVANRAGRSISVLAINGNEVTVVHSIAMHDEVAHVAFTPDGRRALAVKPAAGRVAILDVMGSRVVDRHEDIAVGAWPNNIEVTPNGGLAIVSNAGAEEGATGEIDSIAVIDLSAHVPRLIGHVPAADGLQGLAINPAGTLAVSVATGRGDEPDVDDGRRMGRLVVFHIDGRVVTKVGEVPVGHFPQGVAFSADGAHVYVGNYDDSNIMILRVIGSRVTDTGKRLAMPGQPASVRGRAR